MIKTLLSGDLPRSWVLSVVLAAILATPALAPFLFGGAQAINTAAKVCVFIVLVASYDLLLGYTGIVSFAHTMFFGIGGYGAGIALYTWGPTWTSVALGTLGGLASVHGPSTTVTPSQSLGWSWQVPPAQRAPGAQPTAAPIGDGFRVKYHQ